MRQNLVVEPTRSADIEALAAITEPDRPYTRRAFTPALSRWARLSRSPFQKCRSGNADRCERQSDRQASGKVPGLGVLMLGSHSDTVPEGGRFDGGRGRGGRTRSRTQPGRPRHRARPRSGDRRFPRRRSLHLRRLPVSEAGVRQFAPSRMAGATGRRSDLGRGAYPGRRRAAHLSARSDIRAFLELHIEQVPCLRQSRLTSAW